MMKKKIVGIEIDEILRAKWLQFDKFYYSEFGEEGIPENQYVWDFFKEYKWKDVEEEINILNEDLPKDISPLDYQVDKKTGEAPVDFIAFKKEKNKMTAKEAYNKFMYEDYLLEIHGSALPMYDNLGKDISQLFLKYKDQVDFVVVSKENYLSIPPTLFFLSKIMSRFKKYIFVENDNEILNEVDILITTNPNILKKKTKKKIIKLARPYNDSIETELFKDSKILNLKDLIGNDEFEKIINYKQKNIEKNDNGKNK